MIILQVFFVVLIIALRVSDQRLARRCGINPRQ